MKRFLIGDWRLAIGWRRAAVPGLRGNLALILIGLLFIASRCGAIAADVAPGRSAQGNNSLIDEPAAALRQLTVARGLKVDLFAAEPDVRNPVSLSIDEQGRVFVVESDRRRSSVFDIRGHREWLDNDFSFRTVRERAEFLRREVSPTNTAALERLTKGGRGDFRDFNRDGVIDWRDLEVQSERIRLLEDTNADGRADRISVFAEDFTNIVAGVAAGVLARHGDLYFTCIPDLWRFPDYPSSLAVAPAAPLGPAPRPANRRSSFTNVVSGFGVHIAFGGHDMHGLIFGPDGKLYWSIADRGTDTNLFARIKDPIPGLSPELLADSGCVFRANPDGSEFEVIAWGLRNPQELAFDEWGNLFTADNNGDGGDKARWHHVVEGADFGWRMGWQWLEARAYQPKMGPWNGERLWHLAESNTAAWLLPPLAHIGHGPAGLVYNPGTGLPPQFDRHFFLCDFPGHVLMWTNIPNGASFKAGPVQNFFGELGPTDIAFHPDGGVLVTDWFKTFDKTDKGRVYRVHDPATDAGEAVQDTRSELRRFRPAGQSMEFVQVSALPKRGRSEEEAVALLSHRDQRVREDALADAVHSNLEALIKGLRSGNDPLQRLLQTGSTVHSRFMALRGLERVARATARTTARIGGRPPTESELSPLSRALGDPAPEIRAAAARALASLNARSSALAVVSLLNDPDARVRFSAAEATGRLQVPAASHQLLELLRANDDRELYLRHAAVVALARLADTNALVQAAFPPGAVAARSVRLGTLLALRRLGSAEVARFLSDPDPAIVLESARAINDVPIAGAYAPLAGMLQKIPDADAQTFTGAAVLRRAINAHFRLGQPANAAALAMWAAQTNAPLPLRIEALELLALWPQPPGRDHFMGLWRPLPSRDRSPAADALGRILPGVMRDTDSELRIAALRAGRSLVVPGFDLFAVLNEASQPPVVRVEALRALAEQKHPRLSEALAVAAAGTVESLRLEATKLEGAAIDLAPLERSLNSGSIAERQSALAALARASGGPATQLIAPQLDALLAGTLPKELALDVLEAAIGVDRALAGAGKDSPVRASLRRFTNSLSKDDPLAAWRPVLFGGNAQTGRATFFENQQIACFRCHKLNGEGGDVGPELAGIVARRGREYVLESIVFPNKAIAPGFESALITMKSGTEYAGLIKAESATELELNSPEDGPMKLKKADIAERRRSLSPMPEELANVLSRQELRDLIEFLATTAAKP